MRVLLYLVLASALVVGGCDRRIADAHAQVSAYMWDAHTTQFRHDVVTEHAVCGEANGKADLGDYVGFRRFVVAAHHVYLEPKPAQFGGAQVRGLDAAEIGVGGKTAFDELWRNVCATGHLQSR